VKYVLGFYIPEDGIIHHDRRANIKSAQPVQFLHIFSTSVNLKFDIPAASALPCICTILPIRSKHISSHEAMKSRSAENVILGRIINKFCVARVRKALALSSVVDGRRLSAIQKDRSVE
jgi:hypothetical protein